MSVTLVNPHFLATQDSRVVDKDVQFTLFPENACSWASTRKTTDRAPGMNIREKLLRRPTDCSNIRKIELKENGLLSGLFLKLNNRFIRLLRAARREVNFRVVGQELLWFNELLIRYTAGFSNPPWLFPFRYQHYRLWTKHHVEHTGARAFFFFFFSARDEHDLAGKAGMWSTPHLVSEGTTA
jgi:hypothetical protein